MQAVYPVNANGNEQCQDLALDFPLDFPVLLWNDGLGLGLSMKRTCFAGSHKVLEELTPSDGYEHHGIVFVGKIQSA